MNVSDKLSLGGWKNTLITPYTTNRTTILDGLVTVVIMSITLLVVC